MSRTLLTLTTDFGSVDSYVAQMKGVILGINPELVLVDVTHSVPPQDIHRAAAILDDAVPAFPPGTIHLVVVDPGVGSERPIVAAEMAGQRFVAPDNGVLGLVARHFPPTRFVRLTDRRWWRKSVAPTFHGRDVMSPVAATWSLGHDLTEFGKTSTDPLVPLPAEIVESCGGTLSGRVLWADAFGNLVTNIDRATLGGWNLATSHIQVAGQRIDGVSRYYSEHPTGALLALFGSRDRLEIAVNGGSAEHRLGVGVGAEVRVVEGPSVSTSSETP